MNDSPVLWTRLLQHVHTLLSTAYTRAAAGSRLSAFFPSRESNCSSALQAPSACSCSHGSEQAMPPLDDAISWAASSCSDARGSRGSTDCWVWLPDAGSLLWGLRRFDLPNRTA